VKIQVNSDSSITKDQAIKTYVAGEVSRVLSRYSGKLTRVEVHLTDVNRTKSGTHDKRCRVEARPARHRPLTVSNGARTVKESVGGALTKMRSSLETFFGRMDERRGAGTVKKRMLTAPPIASARTHRRPSSETAPAKTAAVVKPRRAVAKSRTTAKARTATTSHTKASKTTIGHSPKKKGIYQARRKSWPTR
jgi:hypothetical protein